MLFGAGNLAFCTNDLATNGSLRGEELLFPGCIAEFELAADTNFAESYCLIDGVRQVTAGEISEETYTLTITAEFNDWTSLQIYYDELAQNSANVVVPQVKVATIPAGGVITDTDITAANAESVKAYISTRGSFGNRIFLKVVNAAPAAGEVQVDGAANTLTFPAALVGAVVTYIVDVTFTSMETLVLETVADRVGRMQFAGLVYGTELANQMLIRIPSISRTTVPTLTINGDVTTLVTEYRANVLPGRRRPYELYDLSTAVV